LPWLSQDIALVGNAMSLLPSVRDQLAAHHHHHGLRGIIYLLSAQALLIFARDESAQEQGRNRNSFRRERKG
jgi:hypothetical protein